MVYIKLVNHRTGKHTLHELDQELYEFISEICLDCRLSEDYIDILEQQIENPTYYEREDGKIEYRFLS